MSIIYSFQSSFRAVTKLCLELNPLSPSTGPGQGSRLREAKSEGGIYDDGAREMRGDTINSYSW